MMPTSSTPPMMAASRPPEISNFGPASFDTFALIFGPGIADADAGPLAFPAAPAAPAIAGAAAAAPAAVTMNVFMHPGHLAIFPTRSSGTRSFLPQFVQMTEMG